MLFRVKVVVCLLASCNNNAIIPAHAHAERGCCLLDPLDQDLACCFLTLFQLPRKRISQIMGHTALSQKLRTKRPDGRPIAVKKRMALYKKTAEKQTIAELRVTSKQPGEKKGREVTKQNGELKTSAKGMTSEEKLLRALRKKLRDIEQLLLKQQAGHELDVQQAEKLDSMATVIEEMENVAESLAAKKA